MIVARAVDRNTREENDMATDETLRPANQLATPPGVG